MTREPDPELLRTIIRYEPETGQMFWLPRPLEMFPNLRACAAWNARYSGVETSLWRDKHGYRRLHILDRSFLRHRVAWAIFYGAWPNGEIDHENKTPGDDWISNLRQATRSQNTQNCRMRAANKSGWTGVSKHPRSGLWVASIRSNGTRTRLGQFRCPTASGLAYIKAGMSLHGPFFAGVGDQR